MTEQTTPEKKQKSNKALYWCLAIGAIGALCLPQEVQIGIFVAAGATILIAAGIGLARLNKKIKPEQNAADEVNRKWKREVDRARHYAGASLEQGTRAMHAKNAEEVKDASHYEEVFADAARATHVKLNPSPPKLNVLMDKLPKRKRN